MKIQVLKKGRNQCRRLPHCAGSGGGYISGRSFPHTVQCVEATARTCDLSVHRRQALPLEIQMSLHNPAAFYINFMKSSHRLWEGNLLQKNVKAITRETESGSHF